MVKCNLNDAGLCDCGDRCCLTCGGHDSCIGHCDHYDDVEFAEDCQHAIVKNDEGTD